MTPTRVIAALFEGVSWWLALRTAAPNLFETETMTWLWALVILMSGQIISDVIRGLGDD